MAESGTETTEMTRTFPKPRRTDRPFIFANIITSMTLNVWSRVHVCDGQASNATVP